MMLIEQTTVPKETLPLQEFRDHLRLGTGFEEEGLQDEILETVLRAAMASIEARTGKVMIERAFLWQRTGWRNVGEQALPVAPVTAINDMKITDRSGVEEEIDPARFVLLRDAHRPKIVATGACLPTIPLGGVAEVTFSAGFGATWEDIPADLAQAMLMLAAHYYEHRTESSGAQTPFDVSSLIEPYRTVRLLGGGGA